MLTIRCDASQAARELLPILPPRARSALAERLCASPAARSPALPDDARNALLARLPVGKAMPALAAASRSLEMHAREAAVALMADCAMAQARPEEASNRFVSLEIRPLC